MELYTSLVRLKQEMNGGHLPPMTPVPAASLPVIDPALTIGLGALTEDETLGLRCPVRGCGKWRKNMTKHADMAHRDIGGADGIKSLLSIPTSAKLVARSTSEKLRTALVGRVNAGDWRMGSALDLQKCNTTKTVRRRARTQRTTRATVGWRNLHNTCVAQLSHRLIDLSNKIGRTPTYAEAAKEENFGPSLCVKIRETFGSWDAACEYCGIEKIRKGRRFGSRLSKSDNYAVLTALRAWYDAHGSLPDVMSIERRNRTPLTPSRPAILKTFKTDSWPEAMRRAASILNIYGGRYGLPVKKETAA